MFVLLARCEKLGLERARFGEERGWVNTGTLSILLY